MSNSVIYEPRGAALEYSPLAVNLYHGCRFGCKYCYAPAIARKKLAEWSANPYPKDNILEKLERAAKRLRGDKRTILLCYTSDPYQSEEAAALTREALLILEKYEMTVTVLTKGGTRAVGDFDILARNGWQFGSTIVFNRPFDQERIEPYARPYQNRVEAIRQATKRGISTWVSLEPVIEPSQSLDIIQELANLVDFWKVGKLNHSKIDVDWEEFYRNVIDQFNRLGKKEGRDYYIKKELKKYEKGN